MKSHMISKWANRPKMSRGGYTTEAGYGEKEEESPDVDFDDFDDEEDMYACGGYPQGRAMPDKYAMGGHVQGSSHTEKMYEPDFTRDVMEDPEHVDDFYGKERERKSPQAMQGLNQEPRNEEDNGAPRQPRNRQMMAFGEALRRRRG